MDESFCKRRPLLARAQSGGVMGANDRVRLAIIGSGGRGNQS